MTKITDRKGLIAIIINDYMIYEKKPCNFRYGSCGTTYRPLAMMFLTTTIITSFLIFITQFYTLSWAQDAQENSCVTCHASDVWEELQTSVHGQYKILCNDCHGGDPTKMDQESAKSAKSGYIGIPEKKQIAQICGNCHADVEAMNFYGLRTDQLARYKTSVHGKKLLLEGDQKVAVCSDCHGYHDVLKITDPNSTVYPLNLPKTCNRCHGNEKLMKQYDLPSDIFAKYEKSVHGQALLEKKDLSVAHCASCHGSHGAVPPGVNHIGETCGKCHMNEKKNFLESVHAQLTESGKFSECISCHGNHDVQHADPSLYQKACVQCHATASPAAQTGLELMQIFHHSEAGLKTAEATVRQAGIDGIFVEEEMASLEDVKTNFIAMAPAQHTLSAEKIAKFDKDISTVTDEIKNSVHKKRLHLQWRKIALIPLWSFVLIMVVALWAKYKRLTAEHSQREEKRG